MPISSSAPRSTMNSTVRESLQATIMSNLLVCWLFLSMLRHLSSHGWWTDEEEDDDHPPPSSPSLTPSPSPSPLYPSSSTSRCCEPPRTSRVIRSARTQNRYSPIEVKAPSRKGKSAIQRTASGSGDEESKKPKKRREAVSLACYFCRKRKIACRQPPEGNPDRTCK